MKYHTAKPFSMNIKFRLTISISCTNVSVTKFALGLGQRGQDRRTGRQTVRPVRQIARQSGVKKPRNQFNCQIMPMQKHAQYFAVPIFVATIVFLDLRAWSCTFVDWIGLIDHLGHVFGGICCIRHRHRAIELDSDLAFVISVRFALVIFNCLLRPELSTLPGHTAACCICRNYARKSNARQATNDKTPNSKRRKRDAMINCRIVHSVGLFVISRR